MSLGSQNILSLARKARSTSKSFVDGKKNLQLKPVNCDGDGVA